MRRANHQASINVNMAVCIWDVFHKVNVKCQTTNVETNAEESSRLSNQVHSDRVENLQS